MMWINIWKLIESKEQGKGLKIGSQEYYTKFGKSAIALNVKRATGRREWIKVLKCKDHFHAIINGDKDINAKTEKEIAQKLEAFI